jgi:diaminohydroxyphosphoribosylaminopyrimidine deaminase/5-amino-6-(5-phosphoribosylamino)uracil reductase
MQPEGPIPAYFILTTYVFQSDPYAEAIRKKYHGTIKVRSESRYCTMTAGRQRPSVPHGSSRGNLPDAAGGNSPDWAPVPGLFRNSSLALPPPWEERFGPLRRGVVDDLVVVGQSGQSIDARIATPTGHSHYINGSAGLAHLHRLRALVDAVLVGVGTAIADDPQLTVRRVAGPNPVRVVLDPNGRLPADARALAADGVRRLVIVREGANPSYPPGVEVIPLKAAADGKIAPEAVLAALRERGLRRILVEGGANTVSHFLAAGCLDRLHIVVAPLILGSGPPSLSLPPIERVEQAVRAPIRAHVLSDEVLLDCDLTGQRRPVGMANRST